MWLFRSSAFLVMVFANLMASGSECHSDTNLQTPFRMTKTLSVQRLEKKKISVDLPYKNTHKQTVTFTRHAVSCGCSAITVAQREFRPGAEGYIILEIDLRETADQLLTIGVKIDGLLEGESKSEDILRLAEYQVIVPTTDADIRLLYPKNEYRVANDKCGPIDILNCSQLPWTELHVETQNVTSKAELTTATIGDRTFQVARVWLSGCGKLVGNSSNVNRITCRVAVSAVQAGSTSSAFVHVGTVSANLKIVSAIELFPKSIVLGAGTTDCRINIVARAYEINDDTDAFYINAGSQKLTKDDGFLIEKVTSRWYRLILTPEAIRSISESKLSNILVGIDSLNFQEDITVHFRK